MQILPEDQYHIDKWWILRELKCEFLVSTPTEMTTIFYLREKNAPSTLVQSRLLEQLEWQNYIELEKIDDNSYKVVYQPDFVKAYNASFLWFLNYSEVNGINAPYENNVPSESTDMITVSLSKEGRGLWLKAGSEQVRLNRFTTGRPPELIMGYLIINRPGSLVTLAELKRDLEGVASVDDIAEIIRKIGFDKQLKSLFFKYCGTKEVELKNPITITYKEWQEIKQNLNSGKNRKKTVKS